MDADGEAFGPARRSTPAQSRRDVAAGAAEALEYLFVDDSFTLLDIGASQGHALRIRRTRTERADAKRRNGRVTPGDIIPEWWAISSGISTEQPDSNK